MHVNNDSKSMFACLTKKNINFQDFDENTVSLSLLPF